MESKEMHGMNNKFCRLLRYVLSIRPEAGALLC